jgi:hypothetical protein
VLQLIRCRQQNFDTEMNSVDGLLGKMKRKRFTVPQDALMVYLLHLEAVSEGKFILTVCRRIVGQPSRTVLPSVGLDANTMIDG